MPSFKLTLSEMKWVDRIINPPVFAGITSARPVNLAPGSVPEQFVGVRRTEDEVAPAPEHDAHLLHWIACPDGSPPMVWTWNAADRSWHWYDLDQDCEDSYDGMPGYCTGAQAARDGGFRYLCPAVPPSQTLDLPEGEAEFLNAARDLSGGSF